MYDLNVTWPALSYGTVPSQNELTNLYNTIAMLYSMGYRYVALNFSISENVKLPLSTPDKLNPIPLAELRKRFANYEGLHLFSRITLVIADPAKCQNILKLNNLACFDIISVQPTTEKALQLTTTNLDIDIVSLPMATRLSFFLKHKTVGQALTRGIKFEISYSGLIAGPAGYESSSALGTTGHISRKTFLGNCLQLIRASRCQGIVFSSGATEPLHVRNHTDILAVMREMGLKTSNSKEGFIKNPECVLVSGRLRIKSNKQTVMIGNNVGGGNRASTVIQGETAKKNVVDSYKRKSDDADASSKRRKQ